MTRCRFPSQSRPEAQMTHMGSKSRKNRSCNAVPSNLLGCHRWDNDSKQYTSLEWTFDFTLAPFIVPQSCRQNVLNMLHAYCPGIPMGSPGVPIGLGIPMDSLGIPVGFSCIPLPGIPEDPVPILVQTQSNAIPLGKHSPIAISLEPSYL
jgi:hypothetical protein